MMRFYFFHSPTGNVDRATSLAKNPWYYPLYCKLAKANLQNLFSLLIWKKNLKVWPAASISDVVIVQPEPPATLPCYNVLTITVLQLKQNSEHRNFRNFTRQQDLRLTRWFIALLVGAWTFIDYEISWPWISIWCNMNSMEWNSRRGFVC